MFSSPEHIRNIFEQFVGVKALIVGDVMIDSYLQGKVERISPEAPVPVVALKERKDMLGGAANVALNIKSLGAVPLLCSIIGEDTQAEEFLKLLSQEQLDSSGILRSSERITTTKYRIIGNKMQMLRVDHETDRDIDPDQEQELLAKIEGMIGFHKPSVIILEDYNKGILTPAVIEGITRLAQKHSLPVVVDPKRKNFESYRHITLFKPNLKEIREGLKTEVDPTSESSLEKAARRIIEDQQVNMVMITLSDEGIFICDKDTSYRLKAHVRPIADVSGAGDTVISVAALCITRNLKIRDIAALSNLAGGLVCEHLGVVPVNKEVLLKEALGTLIS